MTGFEVSLAAPIPVELASDFVSKLVYVSESLASARLEPGARDRVQVTLKPGRDADQARVTQGVLAVAAEMTRSWRPSQRKVLVSRTDRRPAFTDDPYPALMAAGEIHAFGPGRMAFGPGFCAVLSALDARLRQLGTAFGATTRQFPSLISADVLERCGYLRSFPHALTLVTHLREDLESIRRFTTSGRIDNDGGLSLAPDQVAPLRLLLASTVCFHWYAQLQDSHHVDPLCMTGVGRCFRYESGNLLGVERLWEFSMREIAFMGPRDHVLDRRREAVERAVELLDALGLAYEIESATDPFFIESYSAQVAFQTAFDLKYEVRALLPWKSGSLAVGSFNYHTDFFGRALEIRLGAGDPTHTVCVGFGLERLAFALFAQHGPDPGSWPAGVRAELGL